MKSFIVIIFICSIPFFAKAELSGSLRAEFLTNFKSNCAASFVSAGGSRSGAENYCSCAGEYVADRISREELLAAERKIAAGMAPERLNQLMVQTQALCL